MYIVIQHQYALEHEFTAKRPEIWALVETLGEAQQVVKDRLGEYGDHLKFQWDVQSDLVHTTIVYGGIGFWTIVKDKEE